MPWGWIFAQTIRDERSTKMMVVHWRLAFLRRGQVCFPMHLYERHTFVWENCWEFQTTSPLKPLGQYCSNFMLSLLRLGERKIAKVVLVHWPRWLSCPYMVNTFKNRLLQNQKSPWALPLHKSSGTGDLPKLLKWWSYVDIWHFLGQGQIGFPCICMGPIHLYGKNVENSYFGHLYILQLNRNLMMSVSALMKHKIAKWANRKIQDGHHSCHLENQFSTSLLKPWIALSRNFLCSNRMTFGSKQAKLCWSKIQDGRNGSASLNKMATRAEK